MFSLLSFYAWQFAAFLTRLSWIVTPCIEWFEPAQGAFVLADMLKENKQLKHIMIGHNPIGQRGGRAVLRALDRMIKIGTARTRTVRACARACQSQRPRCPPRGTAPSVIFRALLYANAPHAPPRPLCLLGSR